MSDKELKVFGVQQRPQKIYRTCNFEGLTSKKDEFLEKVVRAMEIEGFMKVSEVKPFRLSLGAKDALKFWDWSWRDKVAKYQMIGNDVLLASNKKGAKSMIGLRAEVRNNYLRFGYSYFRKIELKSVAGIKFLLSLIGLLAYIFLMEWIIGTYLFESGLPIWVSAFIPFIAIFISLIPLVVYFGFIRLKRTFNEFNQRIVDIAESLGGKQITPFKLTTFKLEE
jgi:hypothetical protein